MYGLPGDETSAFGIRGIAPLALSDDRLLFLGLDGVLFDSGVDDWFRGDFGRVRNGGAYLGFRRYVADDWIFGLWGGADAQNTLLDNSFGRFIGGLELYSDRWVLRLNGAVPFGDDNAVGPGNVDHDNVSAIRTAVNRGFALSEEAPGSIDGEAGIRFPFDLPGSGASLEEVRFTLGAFHYFDVVDGVDLSGGRARGEVDLYPFDHIKPGTRLTLEAEYEQDDRFDGRFLGGLRLAVPFGNADTQTRVATGKSLVPINPGPRNLFRPVRRDQDVVTGVQGAGNKFIVNNTNVEVIETAPVEPEPVVTREEPEPQPTASLTLGLATTCDGSPIPTTCTPTGVVGQVGLGFSVNVTATVTNTGNVPATNLNVSIVTNSPNPGVGGTTCGTTLAAGASCQATLDTTIFDTPGDYTITIQLTYFDGTTNQTVTQIIPVTATP